MHQSCHITEIQTRYAGLPVNYGTWNGYLVSVGRILMFLELIANVHWTNAGAETSKKSTMALLSIQMVLLASMNATLRCCTVPRLINKWEKELHVSMNWRDTCKLKENSRTERWKPFHPVPTRRAARKVTDRRRHEAEISLTIFTHRMISESSHYHDRPLITRRVHKLDKLALPQI